VEAHVLSGPAFWPQAYPCGSLSHYRCRAEQNGINYLDASNLVGLDVICYLLTWAAWACRSDNVSPGM